MHIKTHAGINLGIIRLVRRFGRTHSHFKNLKFSKQLDKANGFLSIFNNLMPCIVIKWQSNVIVPL